MHSATSKLTLLCYGQGQRKTRIWTLDVRTQMTMLLVEDSLCDADLFWLSSVHSVCRTPKSSFYSTLVMTVIYELLFIDFIEWVGTAVIFFTFDRIDRNKSLPYEYMLLCACSLAFR